MLPLVDLHSQLDEALNINDNDSVFSELYYTDLINEQRSLFIRNEYNKHREIDPNVQQTLGCVELELVDPHNCCVTVPVGCKIRRSKLKIPNTIEFHHSKGITSVGPVDITKKRFSLINHERVPYIGNGRTNKRAFYAFIHDQYIYVISRDPNVNALQYIMIKGIFEDPTALGDFINCTTGQSCWSPNDPYPLNQWMWAYMKPQILQQLIQKRQMPSDDNNNANDDLADGQMAAASN